MVVLTFLLGAAVSCKSMRDVQRQELQQLEAAKGKAQTTRDENVTALEKITQEKAGIRRKQAEILARKNRYRMIEEALPLLRARDVDAVFAIVDPLVEANGAVVDEELTAAEVEAVRADLPSVVEGESEPVPEVDPIRAPAFSKTELAYVLVIRGTAHSVNDDRQSAIADLQRAYDLDPNSREARSRLGKLLFAEREYERALDVWSAELKEGYRSGDLLYLVARANYQLSKQGEEHRYRIEVARVAIEDAFLENPSDLTIRKWRALLDTEAGRYAEAVPKLEQVVADDPADHQYRKLLANTYLNIDEPGKAADVFEVLVQTGHAGPDVHYALSDIYRILDLPEQAAHHVILAYGGRVQNVVPEECLKVAQLLADAGLIEPAVEWLGRVKPDAVDVYRRATELKIFLLVEQERTADAMASYQGILEGETTVSGELHLLMGDLYLVALALKKAQAAYARATGMAATRAEGLAGQAEAYYSEGLFADAVKLYRQAIEADPEQPRFKLMLQQVETDLEIQNAAAKAERQG